MIGNKIYKLQIIDSTNEYIKKNASRLDHGTIVVAEEQTKGKGQYGNTWESPKGNLYFSVLLNSGLSRESIFSYIMKTSVSLVKLFSDHNIIAKIKYPNDIIINNKKISGILIESIGYENLHALVLGIGINVNQNSFINLSNKATSLNIETNQTFEIDSILQEYCKIYNEVDVSSNVHEEYLKSSILLNKNVLFRNEEHRVTSINEKGEIILECMGKQLTVRYDELSLESFYQFD